MITIYGQQDFNVLWFLPLGLLYALFLILLPCLICGFIFRTVMKKIKHVNNQPPYPNGQYQPPYPNGQYQPPYPNGQYQPPQQETYQPPYQSSYQDVSYDDGSIEQVQCAVCPSCGMINPPSSATCSSCGNKMN